MIFLRVVVWVQVSEGGSNSGEAEDEMVGNKRFGRPVLSASLRADTKFDVTRKAVQVNLYSTDAAGKPVFARYNIGLSAEDAANELAATARKCLPAS